MKKKVIYQVPLLLARGFYYEYLLGGTTNSSTSSPGEGEVRVLAAEGQWVRTESFVIKEQEKGNVL